MTSKHKISIAFPDVSPDVANTLAEDLATEIRREVRDDRSRVEPKVVRTDLTTMDFGTTIVLVLGTPAIIILAEAIAAWAKRTDQADISMNGIKITNVNSRDVSDIIEALNKSEKVQ